MSAKAGIAAATGSQVTPAPDAGNVGIMVVTVANGRTTITAGGGASLHIPAHPSSPSACDKIGLASGDLRYVQLAKVIMLAADLSCVNSSVSPACTSWAHGVMSAIAAGFVFSVNATGYISSFRAGRAVSSCS